MAHSSFENHHARLSIISVISDLKKNVKILILTKQLYEKKQERTEISRGYHGPIGVFIFKYRRTTVMR